MRSVLSDLYPDLRSSSDLAQALSLFKQRVPGSNLFDEIRRMLLFAIAKMQSPGPGEGAPIRTKEMLREVLEIWEREVEEILVHVFDLLYFYGSDATKYLTGIWLSWGTIPHINRRVREYVIRSVCAVLVKHLRRGDQAEVLARDETLAVLKSLPESKEPGTYLNYAVKLLKENWNQDIEYQVFARKGLVKIAHSFLFSRSIAFQVRQETELVGGTDKEKEGYPLKPNFIEMRTILNPLRFLELFTKANKPSEAESAWMFYILAFCVRDATLE